MKGNIRRLAPAIDRELADPEARRRERTTEEQLRSTGEMLRSVFSASPLAIIATDVNGLVTLWNPAAERLFGWTRDEVLGKENPVVPDQRARDDRSAARARAEGRGFTDVEARRVRKDGSFVDVTVRSRRRATATGVAEASRSCIRTSPSASSWRRSSFRRRRWKRSAGSPAASPTTSTTCSPSSRLRASSLRADAVGRPGRRRPRARSSARAERGDGAHAPAARVQPPAGARAEGARPERDRGGRRRSLRRALVGEDVELVADLDRADRTRSRPTRPARADHHEPRRERARRDAARAARSTIATRSVERARTDERRIRRRPRRPATRVSRHRHRHRHGRATRAHLRAVLHDQGSDKGTGLGLATVYGIVKQYEGVAARAQRARRGHDVRDLPAVGARAADEVPRCQGGHGVATRGGTMLLVEDERRRARPSRGACSSAPATR